MTSSPETTPSKIDPRSYVAEFLHRPDGWLVTVRAPGGIGIGHVSFHRTDDAAANSAMGTVRMLANAR